MHAWKSAMTALQSGLSVKAFSPLFSVLSNDQVYIE